MHASHHRANQALNVPAIMRRACGPKDELDALFAARPCKSTAMKISVIVRVHGLGQSGGRPGSVNLAFLQPRALVVNRVQHAEAE